MGLVVYGVISLIFGLWLGHFLTVGKIALLTAVAAVVIAVPAALIFHVIEGIAKGTAGQKNSGTGLMYGALLGLIYIIPASAGALGRKAFDHWRMKAGEGAQ